MDTETRAATIDLNLESLLEDSKRYNFYQLNRLIQNYIKLVDSDQPVNLRFAAKKSLGFPTADIDKANFLETPLGKEIQIVVTFMGLFGPSSPLPAFYTERLLHSDDETQTMRQFLDLINHHLVSLLQDTWEKYRYYIQYQEQATDQISQWLFGMVGFPDIESLEAMLLEWHKLLPLASLFAMKAKNAAGLVAVLEGYFPGISFAVEECIHRKVQIPPDQSHQMGIDNCSMGINAMLGEEVDDRMGKFRIHIHNLDKVEFQDFLPGSRQHKVICNLISLYLRDQFDYDLCLHTEVSSIANTAMGSDPAYLGWNTCMGEASRSIHKVII